MHFADDVISGFVFGIMIAVLTNNSIQSTYYYVTLPQEQRDPSLCKNEDLKSELIVRRMFDFCIEEKDNDIVVWFCLYDNYPFSLAIIFITSLNNPIIVFSLLLSAVDSFHKPIIKKINSL